MTRILARRWLACALAVLALCAHASAHAQSQANVPIRTIGVVFAHAPSLSFSARDFLDKNVLQKLQSGLPQTITTRVYAYPEHGRAPLIVTAVSCRVVYDLWENVYRIERQTDQSDKTLAVKSLDGVAQLCLDMPKLVLGDGSVFAPERGGHVYFGVIVELNPMSQDTVQRIRRWLSRPSGNQLDGNAFFGSFVSIFVTRQMGSAEKTLSFRSELVNVPP